MLEHLVIKPKGSDLISFRWRHLVNKFVTNGRAQLEGYYSDYTSSVGIEANSVPTKQQNGSRMVRAIAQ